MQHLSEILVKNGLLSKEVCLFIEQQTPKVGQALARSILAFGTVSETELFQTLKKEAKTEVFEGAFCKPDFDALEAVPSALCKKLEVLPWKTDKSSVFVLMVDPLDKNALAQLRFFSTKRIKPILATASCLKDSLSSAYPGYNHQEVELEPNEDNERFTVELEDKIKPEIPEIDFVASLEEIVGNEEPVQEAQDDQKQESEPDTFKGVVLDTTTTGYKTDQEEIEEDLNLLDGREEAEGELDSLFDDNGPLGAKVEEKSLADILFSDDVSISEQQNFSDLTDESVTEDDDEMEEPELDSIAREIGTSEYSIPENSDNVDLIPLMNHFLLSIQFEKKKEKNIRSFREILTKMRLENLCIFSIDDWIFEFQLPQSLAKDTRKILIDYARDATQSEAFQAVEFEDANDLKWFLWVTPDNRTYVFLHAPELINNENLFLKIIKMMIKKL